MRRQGWLPSALDWSILTLALCGFAINLLLLVRHLSGGGIAGCGSGSACDELLNSRWSQVLGIPVTAPGGLVYLGVMVSFTARGRRLRDACLGLIAGAAAWFVLVQAVWLGRFCPWCLTAHAIGILITVLGLWHHAMAATAVSAVKTIGRFAAAAVLGIGLMQVYGPLPLTHRIDEAGAVAASRPSAIHARGSGRKVEFDGGGKIYDVAALPHLGRADARRVMVEYFDYSCAACQTMRGYLEALQAKHPADICVVVLPVPLEASCNPALGAWDGQHPDSCELARLALALWRTKPEAFAAFHHALLDGATLSAARARALELSPRVASDAASQDPWIAELIQANIADWVAFSASTRNLPKLLISDKRILHGLPSGEADFIRVMERELGL